MVIVLVWNTLPGSSVGNYFDSAKEIRAFCQNGGSCFEDNRTAVKKCCLCLPGFTGDFCEISIDNCQPNPCANQGTCKDLGSSFSCLCFRGFTGKSCEHSFKSCFSHPCQNGGTCHDYLEGQIICFMVLGLLTCLVILGTTGIVFFSKCKIWLANAKYRHLLLKQRKQLFKDKTEDLSVKIISPSMN
ncbi:protein delta homolog 1 [Narcine bancroftii]|uniref:protein delta homolog 1 n=1 Tax=Narcine bancroftii TaxID=1343680 RepID=UPI00383193C0